jgi:hypothetical protein
MGVRPRASKEAQIIEMVARSKKKNALHVGCFALFVAYKCLSITVSTSPSILLPRFLKTATIEDGICLFCCSEIVTMRMYVSRIKRRPVDLMGNAACP